MFVNKTIHRFYGVKGLKIDDTKWKYKGLISLSRNNDHFGECPREVFPICESGKTLAGQKKRDGRTSPSKVMTCRQLRNKLIQ